MRDESDFALFPLRNVLFPGGRMALRIFERRYLDMVRDCLRNNRGFGIVWLPDGGGEVMGASRGLPRLAELGVEAQIADYDQLPGGLLGLVVEGRRRFRLRSAAQNDDGLCVGDIEWLAEEPDSPLPEGSDELKALLAQLAAHPHVKRLGMSLDREHAGALVNALAQILPLPQAEVYPLLAMDEPLARLNHLNRLLDELGER